MKNNEEEFKEIEKELYNYFEKKKKEEIPLSTLYAIKNAFNRKNKKSIIVRITKIVMYILSIFTILGGLLWAKEITNLVSPYFKCSRSAIYIAAEKGYIQDVESEFVYDNNIGIAIDNVILDNSNLNILYLYDCKENVETIFLQDYEIIDNAENILYKHQDEYYKIKSLPLVNGMRKFNKRIDVKENIYGESILYSSKMFPIIEKLYIHIFKISINGHEIEGNWNLEVDIDPKLNKREIIKYEPENNEHVINSNITMSETSLKAYFEIDELYNDKVFGENKFMLEDINGKKYICPILGRRNLENSSIYYFEFDIGKYNENIDVLFFNLKLDEDKTIEVKLNKTEVKDI